MQNDSPNQSNTKTKQYLSGMKAGTPIIFAFISVGTAYAVLAQQAGLYSWQTVMMSAAVFAGASQMIAVTMLAQGSGIALIIFATFIINLRHLIMSTCVMNRMKGAPLSARLLSAFGVTDESFAIFTTTDEKKCSFVFFLGTITVTYSSWVIGTALGCVLTQFLPELVSNSLNITLYAMFIGLIVPSLKKNKKLTLTVLLTAVLSFLLSYLLSSAWTIIAATLLGALISILIPDNKADKATTAEVAE
ncbi:MAG TPA: AzlC family ABC transporter permease [Clostridia bacterium]|nr:AzlC family ABC transporter permease [Clostridia bacterium]